MSLTEYIDLMQLLLKVIETTSEYGGKRDMLIDVARVIMGDMRRVWGAEQPVESPDDIPF